MSAVRGYGIAVSLAFSLATGGCLHASYPRTPAGGVEPPRAYANHEASARKRFAADARCDKEKVTVEAMGNGVFRAEGCGRSDFYRCEGMGEPTCAVHAPK